MALEKINIGTNEDGSTRWLYRQVDSSDPVVVTGPAVGTVTTSDGTNYDVSAPVVEVAPGHEGEVAHLVGAHLEDNGHPAHNAAQPFVHTCDDNCGPLARVDESGL